MVRVRRERGEGEFGLRRRRLLLLLVFGWGAGGLEERDSACNELDLALVAFERRAHRVFRGTLHKDGGHATLLTADPRPRKGGDG